VERDGVGRDGGGQRVLISGQGRELEGGSHDNSFTNENETPGFPLTHRALKSSDSNRRGGIFSGNFSGDNS